MLVGGVDVVRVVDVCTCKTLETTLREFIDEHGLDAGGWCRCFKWWMMECSLS